MIFFFCLQRWDSQDFFGVAFFMQPTKISVHAPTIRVARRRRNFAIAKRYDEPVEALLEYSCDGWKRRKALKLARKPIDGLGSDVLDVLT